MERHRPNYFHNASLLNDLSVGDLIQIKRGLYSHWAVYIGNGEVIHLAGDDNDGLNAAIRPEYTFTICGVTFNKAKVCKDDFWTVVGDSKAFKNNQKDTKWRPCHPRKIVNNALSKLGNIGYNLLFSNCEHFAKWCRYGISKSDQVDNYLTGAAVGIGAILTVGAIYALSRFSKSEVEENEKDEDDDG